MISRGTGKAAIQTHEQYGPRPKRGESAGDEIASRFDQAEADQEGEIAALLAR